MVNLGQSVFVRGTGRWYHGQSYTATVVDIREDDNTVKIRYADGGFKRFSADEFEKILIKPEEHLGSIVDAIQPYEMNVDQFDGGLSATNQSSQINELDARLAEAVSKRDFQTAASIQAEIETIVGLIHQKRDLEAEIREAVKQRDWAKASEIQAKIDSLESVKSGKEVQLPQESPAIKTNVDVNWPEIFEKAKKRALGSGGAGAVAMVVQVCSLMWMRTIMNYQYRYGTTTRVAFQTLMKQGGIPRLYRGLTPALFQGPLSRFCDTAANTGILTLMAQHPSLVDLPVGVKTVVASATAASMRVCLMPIDTLKTTMQVEGKDGLKLLRNKVKTSPLCLWHGSAGAVSATFVGHYPWFATYNILQDKIPQQDSTAGKLARNAAIGFTSSVTSDTISNSLRVLKTYRQTNDTKISYLQCAKNVIEEDGLAGLFGRGLKTRILANGVQGLMFSVLWKYFDEKFRK